MVNFNEGFSGTRRDQKEVGVDCRLEIAGVGGEVPITNVSFTEEANTSEVQFNTTYAQDIAMTGVAYSGSFDIAGRNTSLRDVLWDDGNNQYQTTLPQHISSLTIVSEPGSEESVSYTFTDVLINSRDKDVPSDDRTTESYDFMAEKMTRG